MKLGILFHKSDGKVFCCWDQGELPEGDVGYRPAKDEDERAVVSTTRKHDHELSKAICDGRVFYKAGKLTVKKAKE